jgi:capsule polysaccharide modification protein KpsS
MIADALQTTSARCLRINYNLCDCLHWCGLGTTDNRSSFSRLDDFVAQFIAAQSVTDFVFIGKDQPYYVVAIAAAKQL